MDTLTNLTTNDDDRAFNQQLLYPRLFIHNSPFRIINFLLCTG